MFSNIRIITISSNDYKLHLVTVKIIIKKKNCVIFFSQANPHACLANRTSLQPMPKAKTLYNISFYDYNTEIWISPHWKPHIMASWNLFVWQKLENQPLFICFHTILHVNNGQFDYFKFEVKNISTLLKAIHFKTLTY